MKVLAYHRYGSPAELKIRETPRPVPREDEVLIRVEASGLNSWDWDMLRGRPYVVRMWGLFRPSLKVLGADVSGVVVSTGAKVTQYSPGDEVYGDLSQCGWGGLGEFTCARENALVRKPVEMTHTDAAAVPQAGAMAMQCLFDHKHLQPGDSLLINGAGGGVGTFALQIARSMGAEVTAVDSGRKLDKLRALGATHVLDYERTDYTRTGLQYDMIIDVIARRTLADYSRALKENGQFLMVGGRGRSIIETMLLNRFYSGKKKLGILAHEPNKHLKRYNEMYTNGLIAPVIDQVYCLEDGATAFKRLGAGEVFGKVIIKPC